MTNHTTPRIWEWTIQNDGFQVNELNEEINISEFRIGNHTFRGTRNIVDARGNIFYLPPGGAEVLPEIAGNLQQSLMSNAFVAANFNVAVSTLGHTKIIIEAKTPASAHAFAFKGTHADFAQFIAFNTAENPFASNEYLDGYYIDTKIAKVSEPDFVSLSDMANYVQFESKNSAFSRFKATLATKSFDFETSFGKNIKDHREDFDKYVTENSTIAIKEKLTQNEHILAGTLNPANVNAATYFIDVDINITAENIKQCLLLSSFISSNYSISKKLNKPTEGTPTTSNSIVIESLGGGESYQLEFMKPADNKVVNFGIQSNSSNQDTIGMSSSIELEIYTDINSRLGERQFPENSLGTYMTTLSKSYHGEPLWFNLNALMANKSSHSIHFLTSSAWCNTGTMTDYHFLAHRFDGKNHQPFYLSQVLYNITGYDRNLSENKPSTYIHDVQQAIYDVQMAKLPEDYSRAKPLSNKLELRHIEGQTQYFNFIRKDSKNTSAMLGIMYKLYTQSGMLIHQEKRDRVNSQTLANVNTIKLKIDEVIEAYKAKLGDKALPVGIVETSLCQEVATQYLENDKWINKMVDFESQPLTFHLLPSCLHTVRDFVFLNALGGWSTFNFEGDEKTDFKASTNTIFKTQTPNHNISSEIESVYSKEVEEKFSVQTMPLDIDTIQWLKEMSTSKAVYELATKRYIIVNEMNIKPDSRNELSRVEMKFSYSDSYNASIN